MIETSRQREKREKSEAAERAVRQERYIAKSGSSANHVGAMTEEEARRLTTRIKEASEGLAQLLLEAHRREAWKALGYDSWRAYATAEFQFSQSRAYRLMAHAETLEVISPIGEKPSEAVTRPLEIVPKAERREVWRDAVKVAPNGKPTAKQVSAAVEEVVATKKTNRITYKPANGLQYAAMAISDLEKIQPNDTERVVAFEKIRDWLATNT